MQKSEDERYVEVALFCHSARCFLTRTGEHGAVVYIDSCMKDSRNDEGYLSISRWIWKW